MCVYERVCVCVVCLLERLVSLLFWFSPSGNQRIRPARPPSSEAPPTRLLLLLLLLDWLAAAPFGCCCYRCCSVPRRLSTTSSTTATTATPICFWFCWSFYWFPLTPRARNAATPPPPTSPECFFSFISFFLSLLGWGSRRRRWLRTSRSGVANESVENVQGEFLDALFWSSSFLFFFCCRLISSRRFAKLKRCVSSLSFCLSNCRAVDLRLICPAPNPAPFLFDTQNTHTLKPPIERQKTQQTSKKKRTRRRRHTQVSFFSF